MLEKTKSPPATPNIHPVPVQRPIPAFGLSISAISGASINPDTGHFQANFPVNTKPFITFMLLNFTAKEYDRLHGVVGSVNGAPMKPVGVVPLETLQAGGGFFNHTLQMTTTDLPGEYTIELKLMQLNAPGAGSTYSELLTTSVVYEVPTEIL